MPFTASHPAMVLPLAYLPRKCVCLTGLVIGSLTPDFEYFFSMGVSSVISHTVGGVFYFCLPVGVMLCFLFHNIIRDCFIDNLPYFLKARFWRIRLFDWNGYFVRRWFVVIPSILVGAGSHILWDSFTHGQLRMYQHPSTLAGAIVITAAIWKMPKDGKAANGIDIKYWLTFAVLSAFVMTICFMAGLRFDVNALIGGLINYRIDDARNSGIGRVVVSSISVCLFSITATSVIWKTKNKKSPQALA